MTVQGLQVLIVDDNGMNRKLISMLLTKLGCKVQEACGGAESVQMVQEMQYDVVFMDHMMPEMDGVEALKQIRGLGTALGDFPRVVALTADDESNGEEYYMQQGFDGYLIKPVLPQKLKELLENL